jgi:hypothetical protein
MSRACAPFPPETLIASATSESKASMNCSRAQAPSAVSQRVAGTGAVHAVPALESVRRLRPCLGNWPRIRGGLAAVDARTAGAGWQHRSGRGLLWTAQPESSAEILCRFCSRDHRPAWIRGSGPGGGSIGRRICILRPSERATWSRGSSPLHGQALATHVDDLDGWSATRQRDRCARCPCTCNSRGKSENGAPCGCKSGNAAGGQGWPGPARRRGLRSLGGVMLPQLPWMRHRLSLGRTGRLAQGPQSGVGGRRSPPPPPRCCTPP